MTVESYSIFLQYLVFHLAGWPQKLTKVGYVNKFLSFLDGIIIHCIDKPQFAYLSVHLPVNMGCFHLLGIVNNAMNTYKYVFETLLSILFGYIPTSAMIGSSVVFFFSIF